MVKVFVLQHFTLQFILSKVDFQFIRLNRRTSLANRIILMAVILSLDPGLDLL